MNLPFEYFDAHCHIQEKEYDADRDEVIARMIEGKVGSMVVGTDKESSEKAIALAEKHPFLFAAIGVHPTDTIVQSLDLDEWIRLAGLPQVVAIGECGLDYYRMQVDTQTERDRQDKLFQDHIALAVAVGKPLMIHCRSAHDKMLATLKEAKRVHGDKLRAHIHFFTASLAVAQAYFDLGCSVSFPGVITFTDEYDDVVRQAPAGMILTETDSPFASPVPYRGTRNEPARVAEVVRRIAELRGVPIEEMKAQIVQNAAKIFALPEAKKG